MKNFNKHLININIPIIEALNHLNDLGEDATIFIIDDENKLIGSLTDGDLRRGFIKGFTLEDNLVNFVSKKTKYIFQGDLNLSLIAECRLNNIKIIPILNKGYEVKEIVNLRVNKSYLPIEAVIMAGGKGTRLMPLTAKTPKPLLKVGEKPIVEYNIDRLKAFGIKNIHISIKYLGSQIVDYFKDGSEKDLNINYIKENTPLGTLGATSKLQNIKSKYILVMNSDILTNIDFESMLKLLIENDGDMVVATKPYEVEIPYGVIETNGIMISKIKEKPTYTYYSNAGIYIFKSEHLELIPKNTHYNATDLMEKLIKDNDRVLNFPISGYWLDVGKPDDYAKAQKDVRSIDFNL